MAFRSQAAAVFLGSWAFGAGCWAQDALRFDVKHPHLRKDGVGVVAMSESGVSYEETLGDRDHRWQWPWVEIQQVEVRPDRLRVLTYRDSAWKLGMDREYEFRGSRFESAVALLREKLGQRLVAAVAGEEFAALWNIPVKHLERFGGSHGTLAVGEDRVAYRTDRKGKSRSWRLEDIGNISSSGPFQLTITTFERARTHYGDRKGFNFQLKQPLDEERYNELWRRLNERQGLQILSFGRNTP